MITLNKKKGLLINYSNNLFTYCCVTNSPRQRKHPESFSYIDWH
jgi:hypothetical protein